jgi:hypothetical protein
MHKTVLCTLAAIALAIPASAQSKLTGKVHCAKGDPNYSIDVGDKPGHMLASRKAACTWAEGTVGDSAVKTGVDVGATEINGATAHDNGYHTATLENGDKFTVKFSGAMALNKDGSGTFEGKWTMLSGTGKLKGIKGSGTYKGVGNADGSGDVTVDGDYTLAAAKAPAKAPAAPAKKK